MSRRATWRPRLVALDVDGCLLEWVPGTDKADERIAPAVHDAVLRVLAAGVPVVLASGRSPHGLAAVADLVGPAYTGDGPVLMVASNGATTCRYPPLEVVAATTFDARAAVRAVLDRLPDALVAVEDATAGYRVTGDFPRGELSGRVTRVSASALGAAEASRVVVRHPDASPETVAGLAGDLGLHGTGYDVGFSTWLDLTPAGVSKASALARVAAEHGVGAADVLAVGDGHNDVAMLRWAGRGVAMGQAPAAVHDAADAVAPGVADDGLAVELDRWFPA